MSGIVRVEKRKGYFMASNQPFNDERLSWEARGLIGYLLSKPDDWECRNEDLLNKGPAGRDKINRMLGELQQLGYMERVQHRDEDGRFYWVTTIFEEPKVELTQPRTIDAKTVNGSPVNGSAINGKGVDIIKTESPTTESLITKDKDGASPEAEIEPPNSRKADDFLPPAETQMQLLLGSLTNPDGGARYDQAEKDLLASGWNIRSKPIKDAAIHFLAATGWEVPSAVGIRRDWIKSLEEHITEFGLAGLYAMYSEVIQTATHRLSRPGSLTKAMSAIKNARSSDRKHVADDWMDDPQYQTFAALPETEEVSWAAFLNPANER